MTQFRRGSWIHEEWLFYCYKGSGVAFSLWPTYIAHPKTDREAQHPFFLPMTKPTEVCTWYKMCLQTETLSLIHYKDSTNMLNLFWTWSLIDDWLNQTHLDKNDTFKVKEQTDIGEDNDTNTKDTQLYDRSNAHRQAVSLPKRVVMGNNNHFCPGPVCRPPAKTSAESSHGAHICVVFLIKVHIPFSNVSFPLLRQHKQTRRVQNNQKYIGDPKPTRLDSFQFFRAVLPSFFPTLALPYMPWISVCTGL